MTIHSAKGNGREVVILLNMCEKSLKIFSKNEINLIYDSFLHVAVTRCKHQLYIGYIYQDHIYKKLI